MRGGILNPGTPAKPESFHIVTVSSTVHIVSRNNGPRRRIWELSRLRRSTLSDDIIEGRKSAVDSIAADGRD